MFSSGYLGFFLPPFEPGFLLPYLQAIKKEGLSPLQSKHSRTSMAQAMTPPKGLFTVSSNTGISLGSL